MSKKELPSDNQGYMRISEIAPDQLKGVVRKATLQRLMSFEEILLERGEQGLLDWLRTNTSNGINPLAREAGVSNKTLANFCDHFGIPRPSVTEMARRQMQKNWQDPDFVQRHAGWSSQTLQTKWGEEEFRENVTAAARARLENPEFIARLSDNLRNQRSDPDFLAKMNAAIRQARQDPEYREGVSTRIRAMWEDPQFRERQARIMGDVYTDPAYRRRHLEGLRKKYEDAEWLDRRAEASRRARFNPENISRYRLPTIQGERRDIGFFAQSTWEANIGRVLMYCGRDFYVRETLRLTVPPEYQDVIPNETSETSVDFVTLDPRGNIIVYEIMAHPAEDPIGWTKLGLLIDQYPDLRIRPIIPTFYKSIRRHFEKRINVDPRFSGWETSKDNLRNNPEKYAVKG